MGGRCFEILPCYFYDSLCLYIFFARLFDVNDYCASQQGGQSKDVINFSLQKVFKDAIYVSPPVVTVQTRVSTWTPFSFPVLTFTGVFSFNYASTVCLYMCLSALMS